MKKLSALVISVMLWAGLPGIAGAVLISPWVGYGTVGLYDASYQYKASDDLFRDAGVEIVSHYYDTCWIAGVDFSFFRFSFLAPVSLTSSIMSGPNAGERITESPSLTMVMVGYSYPPNPVKSVLTVKIFGGFAYTTIEVKDQFNELSTNFSLEGSAFVGDAVVGVKLGDSLEVDFTIRGARIPEVRYSKDYDNGSWVEPQGTVLRANPADPSSSPVPYDFSGISLSIAYKFSNVFEDNEPARVVSPPPVETPIIIK